MTPTSRSRRFALLAALLAGAGAACESLTTPEHASQRVSLVFLLESTAVDTTNLATGDTLDFVALAFTEPDSVLSLPKSQTWSSATDDTLRLLAPASAGRFVARRVGGDTVRVEAVVHTDVAGDVLLRGSARLTVRRELFFGEFVPEPPYRFGDLIAVTAPPEQRFSPGSQLVLEPDPAVMAVPRVPALTVGALGDSVLVLIVPAGFRSDTARLSSIQLDGRELRTRRSFFRASNDNDLDGLEFNDDSANASALAIPDTLLLSIHGAAADFPDAIDQDLFTFTLENPATLTFRLFWNVPSNLDFEIYYVDALGLRQDVHLANSLSTSGEEATVSLEARLQYFLRVYPEGTYVGPTTYIFLIE